MMSGQSETAQVFNYAAGLFQLRFLLRKGAEPPEATAVWEGSKAMLAGLNSKHEEVFFFMM